MGVKALFLLAGGIVVGGMGVGGWFFYQMHKAFRSF